ncbi:MAG: CoA transferase, partial [Deltaproteobacteria bacterium]|nr:CoA transferase [Deltaproteobacteria bacterium]
TKQRQLWKCKDGFVIFYILAGGFGARANRALTKWMEEEGWRNEFLMEMDWDNFDMATSTQETQERLEEPVARFFEGKTKAELYENALKHRLPICPVATPEDLVNNKQLESRGFWTALHHPEIGEVIKYPGVPGQLSETPLEIRRRAPCMGEHNEEIYLEELGFSSEQFVTLKHLKII